MKKFVIAAVAAAALTTTLSAETCATSFSGFYAGLQAGMNTAIGKVKDDEGNTRYKQIFGSQSFIGGLFAGYGMGVGSCAYVGGEVYGNFADNNIKVMDKDTHTLAIKNNTNFGAKVRLGYTVSPQAMIFLGLGAEYSKWTAKYDIIGGVRAAGVDAQYKKTVASFVFAPSVGMEMFMTKNIFVRGEYTYAIGSKVKMEVKDRAGDEGTFKSNVNQHRFTLGLGYKF